MQLWRFNCQRMTRSNRQANTMKESVKFLTLAMVFLSAVKISKQCGPPGPDAPPPPTLEELVQLAPIVVRGYVVRKIGDVDVGYTACLYITHVYKGSLNSNYICADNFGPSSACLVNPTYGVEYLFFLNKTSTGYRARYDRSFSAAEPFNDKVLTTVRDGICCPRDLGGEYNVFTYNYIYRATVTLHRIAFHTGTDTKTLLVTLLLYTSIFINYTSIFFNYMNIFMNYMNIFINYMNIFINCMNIFISYTSIFISYTSIFISYTSIFCLFNLLLVCNKSCLVFLIWTKMNKNLLKFFSLCFILECSDRRIVCFGRNPRHCSCRRRK